MIKTSFTPQTNDLHILLPNGYVGKKIEVLLYTTDEIDTAVPSATKKIKPSDFAGTLSKDDAAALHKYVAESRNEWERNI